MTKTQLKILYDKYISKIMDSGTSMSFEAILYILSKIEENNYKTILDLGSSFISVALRTIPDKEVVTIQDDKVSIEKNFVFCTENNLKDTNMMYSDSLQTFMASSDFIVYKFSDKGNIRFDNFPAIFKMLNKDGMIYVDDCHGPDSSYRNLIIRISEQNGCKASFQPIQTWDAFGRYGCLIKK